jgi:micrococcal nuclease
MRNLVGPAAALVAAALVAAAAWYLVDTGDPGTGDAPGLATVVRVVDGDTLVVEIDGTEERLRLIGIDTPESVAEDRPVECYGAEASDHLAGLLPPGTDVRLERDLEARDRYDRLLAYVYRSSDDVFVNHDLVVDGFAVAREYPPNTTHSGTFADAERGARAAGAGLWGTCGGADVPVGPPATPRTSGGRG